MWPQVGESRWPSGTVDGAVRITGVGPTHEIEVDREDPVWLLLLHRRGDETQ